MKTSLGLLHLEFHIHQASSLKDKRRLVKSFKDRISGRFNVSIAEVDAQDDRHRAILAIAAVGSDSAYLAGVLQKIVNGATTHRDMILVASEVQWL